MWNLYNAEFSTFDFDNDGWQDENCAATMGGGFWYDHIGDQNVNGPYGGSSFKKSMFWEYNKVYYYKLVKTQLMVRPAA